MATSRNRVGSENDEILTLHEMFRIVGDQMTPRDVSVLKFLYSGTLCDELKAQINDGFTFLLALEKKKSVDESNFKNILDLLRIITRHDLTQYVTLRKRRTVSPDPVDCYLERYHKSRTLVPFSCKRPSTTSNSVTSSSPAPSHQNTSALTENRTLYHPDISKDQEPNYQDLDNTASQKPAAFADVAQDQKESLNQSQPLEDFDTEGNGNSTPLVDMPPDENSWIPPHKRRKIDRQKKKEENESKKDEITKKVTCDIRLRVRAEYCNHTNVLQGNVFSNKPTLIERQFEKFMQANTILKSRDLGSIHCDIKFSELTYLDAFWRDYVNGSLLEALKGVFITDSLKQAVGHEAIKLLVNVDEDDYDAGRLKLMQNLKETAKS